MITLNYQVDLLLIITVGVSHEYRNPYHGDAASDNGYAYQATSRNFLWQTINELEYNDVFGDNEHFVSALIRQSFAKNKSHFHSAYGENVAADGLYYVASFNTNESGFGSFGDYKELRLLSSCKLFLQRQVYC